MLLYHCMSKQEMKSQTPSSMQNAILPLQNQRLAPPPDFNPGRRRQRLVQQKDLRKEEQQPQTIDAEELEDVIAGKDAEEAKIKEDMKDVSSKPRR